VWLRSGEERVWLRQDAERSFANDFAVHDRVEEKREPREVEHCARVLADRDDRAAKAGVPRGGEVLTRRTERRHTLMGQNRAQRSLLVVREAMDGLGVWRVAESADLEADPAATQERTHPVEARPPVEVVLVVPVRVEGHDLVRR